MLPMQQYLMETNEPLTTTQISEIITKLSSGHIYKISSTLKDSLEHRLRREGYVQGVDNERKSRYQSPLKGSSYWLDGYLF